MIGPGTGVRVYLACGATDMRKGIGGLAALVGAMQQAIQHWFPWQLFLGRALPRVAAYVIGTLAGCRSQLTIAAGSGAAVATDLLTLWNEGVPVQVHDSTKK